MISIGGVVCATPATAVAVATPDTLVNPVQVVLLPCPASVLVVDGAVVIVPVEATKEELMVAEAVYVATVPDTIAVPTWRTRTAGAIHSQTRIFFERVLAV